MNATTVGLLAGLLLAIAIATGGSFGFLLAVVLGLAGFVVGRVLDGELDLTRFTGRGRDR